MQHTGDGHFELSIRGMHCVGCARGVQKVMAEKGAGEVVVDFATGHATFTLPHPELLSTLITAVADAGYEVTESLHRHEDATLRDPVVRKFALTAILTAPLLLHMVSSYHLLHDARFQLALSLPVFFIAMLHFGTSAVRSLRVGIPNMDVLISLGVISSFGYSVYGLVAGLGPNFLFFETSASITCFALLGNVLEHRAIQKTTIAIEELSRIQVRTARRIIFSEEGESQEEVPLALLKAHDTVLVSRGEKVPADGTVTEGSATIDESMITGEGVPREKNVGSSVIGGTLVATGSLKVQVTAVGEHTVLAGIIRIVRAAYSSKPKIQRLADRASALFVPVVLSLSAVTFLINWLLVGTSSAEALLRAVAVLVVACPCAMGLATPTAVIVGIGLAARRGIVIKGGETLERLAEVKTFLFDKTGTLTRSTPEVDSILVFNSAAREKIEGAIVALERHSGHPIAHALLKALNAIPALPMRDVVEVEGRGISGISEQGTRYLLGSRSFLQSFGLVVEREDGDIFLAEGNVVVAGVRLKEHSTLGAASTISSLKELGYRVAMVSGDTSARTKNVAQELGVTEWYAEQTPEKKMELVSKIDGESRTAFVGDGINDAPSLTRASVGISLSSGTDVALQSSQVVLLKDDLQGLVSALQVSQATLTTIRQNLFWAFFYNIVAIPVAAIGLLSPIVAAFAMAFSDVIVIGNSLRLRTRSLPLLSKLNL